MRPQPPRSSFILQSHTKFRLRGRRAALQALEGLHIPASLDSLPKTVKPKQAAQVAAQTDLIPSITLFDQLEIYPGRLFSDKTSLSVSFQKPGSKLQHFKKLHEATGIDYKARSLVHIAATPLRDEAGHALL